ncbi:hypothetical protein LJK87_22725 [Paenibacillus sp. P25]|nr:hypothetical protein LJK87_22725 [Paenibacillus sp. P25]
MVRDGHATFEFNDNAVQNFTEEWMEIVRQQYNHPSIITWVPFNESWGIGNIFKDRRQQKFTEAIYHLTKAFDPEPSGDHERRLGAYGVRYLDSARLCGNEGPIP